MAAHIPWTSIGLFHSVLNTLRFLTEDGLISLPTVRYRAKVKLHGTNAGVQVRDGAVIAQSRKRLLTPNSGELNGFARWVHAHRDWFAQHEGLTFFGEWAGPGVATGVALASLPNKVYALFALLDGDTFLVEPEAIAARIGACPDDLFVLPWHGEALTVDYTDEPAILAFAETVSTQVEAVERSDPWVKATFGVEGVGEGLVFYPVDVQDLGREMPLYTSPESMSQSLLMFKAKGDQHRMGGVKRAAQVAPEVAASLEAFVAMVVTEARLQQGVAEAVEGPLDLRHIGGFLKWVTADVEKECTLELEAAGLTWKAARKAVQAHAKAWFRSQLL